MVTMMMNINGSMIALAFLTLIVLAAMTWSTVTVLRITRQREHDEPA